MYYRPINHQITKLFKNTELKISYNTDNIVFDEITPKINIAVHKHSGVYKIQCPEWNKFYVGKTK